MQQDNRPTMISPLSGRVVNDTEQHARWREDYYKRVADNQNETENAMRRAIAARNMGDLNILGTREVAELLKCSQATAWLYMREKIIPSFKVGSRYFTHDYIIDLILEKGRALVKSGYADRMLARVVWKSDNGKKW